jgi:hypothetical protein
MLKELGCPIDIEHSVHDICRACVMEEVNCTCLQCHIHMDTRILTIRLDARSQIVTKVRIEQSDIRKAFHKASKEQVHDGEGYLLPKSWLKCE